jgi:hypothetical protein
MEPKTISRTRNNNKLTYNQLATFASAIIGRADLMMRLGQQYGGQRNLYEALGYKKDLTFDDYYVQYDRQDIAKAIIDRPVNTTWQGALELIESNIPEDTEFEKAWNDLNRKFGIKTRLARVDRLTGIGQYGILLLGLDDVKSPEGWSVEVKKGTRKLVYLKPFSEKTAKIDTYVEKSNDPRYGMPLTYDVTISAGNNTVKNIKVHYSRVVHITDGNLESEIIGIPRLKAVFNRLTDIEKIVGGDAEMFWRSARPGYKGMVDKEYTMTTATKNDLLEQLDEYEHDLRRFLINEGVDIEALTQQIVDPSSHVDTQLKMVSAETGIPIRVLIGSERGELASSEDRGEWLSYIQSRREEHAEPRILRPMVDRMIELGILPTPSRDYSVKWADLFSISEKARVEIGKGRANALREYTTNPISQAIIPPTVFMMKFLGLTRDEIELVNKIREDEMEEEISRIAKIKEELEPTPPPATGGGGPTRSKTERGDQKNKPTHGGEVKRKQRQPV